jgi:phage protein D/phage baseplate assembly protein gpV
VPRQAEEHVASIEVRVDGTPLAPELAERLVEVGVRDNLMLPDTATVRVVDPRAEHVDRHPFQVGATVEVRAGGIEDRSPGGVLFKGEVAAMEPEFAEGGLTIAVRAYDQSFKLHAARRTRTFQDQTSADIVRRVGEEHGLRPGTIDATGGPHRHLQQSGESDWDLCWRLAAAHDFEFVVDDELFHFRRAGSAQGAPIELAYPETLLSFKPRLSGVQQVREVEVRAHDAATQRTIVHRASQPTRTNGRVGVDRAQVVDRLRGGELLVADRVVEDAGQARALAQSTLDRLASTWVEADGGTLGNPALRAGCTVKVTGVGRQFSGEYHVSSTVHSYRGAKGYRTGFTIAGRSARGLLDLLQTPQKRDWGASLVIGIVTNNNDPEDLGRVRVRFPSLGDNAEGWWARVAVMNAGDDRGVFMLPQVEDEVVVGFEHGDTRRPYVLGSLFNGVNRPPQAFLGDRRANVAVKSPDTASLEAAKEIAITSDEKITVTASGGPGEVLVEGTSVTIKASAGLEVEAGGSLKLKGATVDLEGSGPVNVKGSIINLG